MVSLILIVVAVLLVIVILNWFYGKLPPGIQDLVKDFLHESFK